LPTPCESFLAVRAGFAAAMMAALALASEDSCCHGRIFVTGAVLVVCVVKTLNMGLKYDHVLVSTGDWFQHSQNTKMPGYSSPL
jgi:hypothetical protein